MSTTNSLDAAQDFAGEINAKYIYRLRAEGIDVNDVLGEDSPFPWEREIAVPGGVPASSIEGVFGPEGFLENPFFLP